MTNEHEAAVEYHNKTKHSPESVRASARRLDFANQPAPFKVYPDLAAIPLPTDFDESDRPAIGVRATDAQSSRALAATDRAGLAHLLFYTAGVTRRRRSARGGPMLLRAAPSAGALYPVEVYVACADLHDLPAGLYHFGPVDFSLRRLRSGDVRPQLAVAAADPAIACNDIALVLTGIPWRTGWKYGDRGFRHLYWDAGTILAQLISVAHASRLSATIDVGFVDTAVADLVGVGDGQGPDAELPLAVVRIGDTEPEGSAPEPGQLEPISPVALPLSVRPHDQPAVREAQHGADLADPAAVVAWRRASRAFEGPSATDATEPPARGEPLTTEDIILRRGSTRRFDRDAHVEGDALTWATQISHRPVPADFLAPGRSLLEPYVAVHAVEGYEPGLYRQDADGLHLLDARVEDLRSASAFLCLGQDLGGDSAYTIFYLTPLAKVTAELGARGYRAALLEAGIAVGRLHLAAYALGYGASGITFYDDLVSELFDTESTPMLAAAVGAPGYRSRPGDRPRDVPRISIKQETR